MTAHTSPSHSTPVDAPSSTPAPNGHPLRVVQLGDTRITILGTAHVSRSSAEEVERLVSSGEFDAVAIELDTGRHAAIVDPDRWSKVDLFRVVREGKAGAVAASLALGAFQQRLADQFGIEPGAEMRAAIRSAAAADLPLLLVDREIGVTLKRVYRNVPWYARPTIFGGLLAGVISKDDVSEEEVERLKEGDVLEATFAEFAEDQSRLYEPLIAERDRYMAARLREELEGRGFRNVLVVIGAGHLKGLAGHLEAVPVRSPAQERAALEAVPPAGPWGKLIPWVILALVFTGFGIGFWRSPELGVQLLLDWVLVNGTLAALGALIATAHPVTILTAFLAAPLTSLNPFVGVGFVAAGIELFMRRPRVGDFESLRQDVTRWQGWWRNRVARTLLVFLFATLGSAAGTYIGGALIYGRLFGAG